MAEFNRSATAACKPSPGAGIERMIRRVQRLWRHLVPVPSLMVTADEIRRLQSATAEADRWLLLGEEMAGLGHWRLSLPDLKLIWSDQVYRIYGLDKAETSPTLELALDAYHPEDRERVSCSVAAAIERKTGFENHTRLVRPTGEIRHVWSRGVVQTDADGNPVSLFGVFIDVTEQKRAEAEQATERERLAQAGRMEALGQLAGGVAHDINNVLQTVAAASGMIETKANQPGEVARLASLIGRTTERAAAIVSRLLLFARRSPLQEEAVDVACLLCGLTEILGHTLGGAIKIDLDLPGGLPRVKADGDQLETVLINLAANARDAMTSGGTITISAMTHGRGTAGLPHGLPPGSYVSIAVADDGIGMDEATLARAVEPFFTTKPRGRGTGLGLSMAAGFAEQSGGVLCLTSIQGKGTCIKLWLPEARDDAFARPAVSPSWGVDTGKKGATILLVDDENDLRELLAAELADRGYSVVQAVDGAAAHAWLKDGGTVDLLVTDLSMPGLDGVSLIYAAQTLHPALPAILLTGHALDIGRLAPDRSAGCHYTLLSKPVRSPALAAEIAQLLAPPRQRRDTAMPPPWMPAQERVKAAM